MILLRKREGKREREKLCFHVYYSIFTIALIWNQPRYSSMNKFILFRQDRLSFSHKQNEILSFVATWMEVDYTA
jgi:hypothetical protein